MSPVNDKWTGSKAPELPCNPLLREFLEAASVLLLLNLGSCSSTLDSDGLCLTNQSSCCCKQPDATDVQLQERHRARLPFGSE